MQVIGYDKKHEEKKSEKESLIHVVRFMGGLGNQLFQYGLYKTFEELGYPTYADTKELRDGSYFRNYQLEFLGIHVLEADKRIIRELYGLDNKILRAIIKRVGKKTYIRQRKLIFDSSIMDPKSGYFDGYWQSYKYFENYASVVKNSIHFPTFNVLDENGAIYYDQIMNSPEAVSVHVRLGDSDELQEVYGGICTFDYYKKSMDYISNELTKKGKASPIFFVFSNDIDRAKKLFDRNDMVYVSGNSEDQGYIDMNLMHCCHHHIIANSSFSWWGAFLGEKEDSITVAPKKWIAGVGSEDIVPPNWIKI